MKTNYFIFRFIPLYLCIKYSPLVCTMLLIITFIGIPYHVYYPILTSIILMSGIFMILKKIIQKEYLWILLYIVILFLYNPYIPIALMSSITYFLLHILIAILFLIEFYTPLLVYESHQKFVEIRKYPRDKIY